MKQTVKNILSDIAGGIQHYRQHRMEVRKFGDSRRQAIAAQYPLSEEQKGQIDRLFETNYGEKIAYVWHQNYAAHAGKFDYRLFPEVLYTPEFEAYQNQNKAAVRMMGDKNFLPLVAKSVGVKMPRTIVSCTNGLLRDGENSIITPAMANELLKKEGTFFVKPSVGSCSGQGCVKVEMDDEYNVSHNTLILNKLRGGGICKTLCVRNLSLVTNQSERYILTA